MLILMETAVSKLLGTRYPKMDTKRERESNTFLLILCGVFTLILFSYPAFAVTDISACQDLSIASEYYNLTQNVSSTGTCFNVLANNITLDGQGYWINYSNTSAGYGVNITSRNNITIKNLNIVQGNSSVSNAYGVYGSTITNSTITNNTLRTGGSSGISNYGIYFVSSSNSNNISDNIITTSGGGGAAHAIYLSSSNTNRVTNNNINTSGTTGRGIFLLSSSTNTLTNNNITTSGDSGYGIYLSSSNSNTLLDNIVTTSNVNNAFGIYLASSTSNNITGGSIISRQSYDYYLQSAGATNNFTDTNFTASRKIYITDTASWFNYRNDSSANIWLKTNISIANNYTTRVLVTWSQSDMKWNDTNSTTNIIANYNITGLLLDTQYNVYNTSGGVQTNPYTLTTDSVGSLNFSIALNGNTEIRVTSLGINAVPTVMLNSPINNFNQTSASITFNCTAYDDINLTNVTLYSNFNGWQSNGTNSSGINNTEYTFTRTAPTNGTFTWNCLAYDNSSQSSFASQNFTITVDGVPPTAYSPPDMSYPQTAQATINWTLYDNYASGYYVVYRNGTLYNQSTWTNNTNLNIPINTSVQGTWNYTIKYNDSLGNNGISDTVIITITADTVPPAITFISPTWNNNTNRTESWAYINVTLSETGNASLLEWNNGTLANYTMQGSGTNFYLNMTSQNGTITYKVYANDTLGNMNVSETRIVTLNYTATAINCTDVGSDGVANNIITVCADYSCNCYTDGVNDQVEINNAILSAMGQWTTVHIKSGTYILNWSGYSSQNRNYAINMQQNMSLEGEGRNTILKLTDNYSFINESSSSYTNIALIGTNVTNFRDAVLKNFTLEGNWGNNLNFSVASSKDMWGIRLPYASNVTISHVQIYNVTTDALWFTTGSGTDSTIQNVIVKYVGHDGIRPDFPKNLLIKDVYVEIHGGVSSGNTAIRLGGDSNITIENATGIGDGGYGLGATTTNLNLKNVTVRNSRFASRVGLSARIGTVTGMISDFDYSNTIFFEPSYSTVAGDSVIWIYNASNISFENVVINGGRKDGIRIENSTSISVKNSIISDNEQYGINGTANVTYTLFFNNTLGDYINGVNVSNITNETNPLFYNVTHTYQVFDEFNDFHLKSTVGRWNGTAWVTDAQNSPAIDAGEPADDYSLEPQPNGGRINIGAYGNTQEASKSIILAVSLVGPIDTYLTNNATVVLNCSASSGNPLVNITLYTNQSGIWASNGTANISGTINSTAFTRTLTDGSYLWNCMAYDNSGSSSFASGNYTFAIDTVKPIIANITASSITTSSATLTWDTNELSNATLYYGTTIATTSNSTNSTLTTSHSISLSGLSASTPYYYNISSCDQAGNCNTSIQYNFTTSAIPVQETPSGCTGCGGGSGGSTVAQNKTNQTTGNMTTIVPATENTTNAIATQDPEIKLKAEEKINEIKAKITPSDINAKEKLGEAEAAYNAGDYTRAYSAAIEAEGLIGKGVTAKGGEMQNPRNPYFTYAVLAVVLTLAVYAFRKNLLFKPGKESAKEPQVPLKPQNAPLPKATIKKQPVNPASKDKGLDDIEKRLEEIKRKIGK